MAVKFPLEMKDGVMVRNINELKKYFDINKVVSLFLNGRLLAWLNSRNYDEEYNAVAELNESDKELARKLCDIFEMEYMPDEIIDTRKVKEQNERLMILKQYTEDDEIINKINLVAFSQSELINLVNAEVKKIYLCGSTFIVPIQEGITYIGVNEPEVSFGSEDVMKFYINGSIKFQAVKFTSDLLQEINRKKNYRIEERITRIYENEENREGSLYDLNAHDLHAYFRLVEGDIDKIYNTYGYINSAKYYCNLWYNLGESSVVTHKDENGKYEKINCLYRIYDDREELLFGKKIGIARYASTEKYVFFSMGLYGLNVLYVFDKSTEEIVKLKEDKYMLILDAYEDKCIYAKKYSSYGSLYSVESIDINGNIQSLSLSAYVDGVSWVKDGKKIYEGFIYKDILFCRQSSGITAFNLRDSTSHVIYAKGEIGKVFIAKKFIFFYQDSHIFAYDMELCELKVVHEDGKWSYLELDKLEGNKLLYHNIHKTYEFDISSL